MTGISLSSEHKKFSRLFNSTKIFIYMLTQSPFIFKFKELIQAKSFTKNHTLQRYSCLPHGTPHRVPRECLLAADDHEALFGAAERDAEAVAVGDESELALGVAADAREHDDIGLAALCGVDGDDAEVGMLEAAECGLCVFFLEGLHFLIVENH